MGFGGTMRDGARAGDGHIPPPPPLRHIETWHGGDGIAGWVGNDPDLIINLVGQGYTTLKSGSFR